MEAEEYPRVFLIHTHAHILLIHITCYVPGTGLGTGYIVWIKSLRYFLNIPVDIPSRPLALIAWSSGNKSMQLSLEHSWYLNTWDHMKDELGGECRWERQEPWITAGTCQTVKGGQSMKKKLQKRLWRSSSQWSRSKMRRVDMANQNCEKGIKNAED